MAGTFSDQLCGFSEWILRSKRKAFPDEQLVYVIRVVDGNLVPLKIQRARQIDDLGILYIGSGNGSVETSVARSRVGLAEGRRLSEQASSPDAVVGEVGFRFAARICNEESGSYMAMRRR